MAASGLPPKRRLPAAASGRRPNSPPFRLAARLAPAPRCPAPAAHGLKFAQSKVAYHSKEIEGLAGRYANPPVQCKESLGSVMDAIRTKFTGL